MIKDKDGNMIAGVFSSEDETWGTPRDLYKKLDAEYHFTLDPCATHGNTFLRGRLKFEKADGTPGSSAPFPSAIVVFKRSE